MVAMTPPPASSRRQEAVPELLPLTAAQVERAAYGKLTLRF